MPQEHACQATKQMDEKKHWVKIMVQIDKAWKKLLVKIKTKQLAYKDFIMRKMFRIILNIEMIFQ